MSGASPVSCSQEEEAPSSPEVHKHPSSTPMSPTASAPEVPKASQVEAKEVLLIPKAPDWTFLC